MVDQASHHRQAETNALFLEHVKVADPPQKGWEFTVVFYELVHHVEAVFASRDPVKGHSQSHSDRFNRLHRDPAYSKIQPRFNSFFEASVIARYLAFDKAGAGGYSCFEEYMQPEDEEQLLKKDLPNLRSICAAMAKKANKRRTS